MDSPFGWLGDFGNDFEAQVNCGSDRSLDGRGEPNALVEIARLASDDDDAINGAAEAGKSGEDDVWAHGVRVDGHQGASLGGGPRQGSGLGFDQRESPRRLTHGNGVDQDESLVALEKIEGEVNAADPVILDPHPFRERLVGEELRHLDSEGVVRQEHVSDARDENATGHGFCLSRPLGIGSTSSARK